MKQTIAEYSLGIGLALMVVGIGIPILPMFWIGVGILIFSCFAS